MASKVRVYMGCSADGFIAGFNDDLSFLERAQKDAAGQLPDIDTDGDAIQYDDFMADIGAMLMGRNTYDFVASMDIPWPYGELPIVVLTSRPLDPPGPQVTAYQGDIHGAIAEARRLAGDKDVYLDGGQLVRMGLDAGLVDELVITMVPILLGQGISLFAGLQQEHMLEFQAIHRFNQRSIQWIATPKKTPSATS